MANIISIQLLQSGPERVTNLVLKTATPYNWYVAYSVALPPLVKKGSILTIVGQGEVTNNYAYNIGVTGYLCFGNSASDYGANGILLIDHASGEDIIDGGTTGHNHLKIDRSEIIMLDEDLNNKYVNLVLAAYSSSASVGDAATLMQGYGSLKVLLQST